MINSIFRWKVTLCLYYDYYNDDDYYYDEFQVFKLRSKHLQRTFANNCLAMLGIENLGFTSLGLGVFFLLNQDPG